MAAKLRGEWRIEGKNKAVRELGKIKDHGGNCKK